MYLCAPKLTRRVDARGIDHPFADRRVFGPKPWVGRRPQPLEANLAEARTVYEAAGGQDGLLRLAQAWHARVLAERW
jgi:hypothetical protein